MKIALMRWSQWLLVISLVSGCMANKSSIPTLPTELDGKGLVVARFAVPGRGYLEGNEIIISGSTYRNAIRTGQLALALPPGEYDVEKVLARGYYLYTIPYPRKFRIEANSVTNLGLIVVLTDKKNKDKFLTVVVDNSREMLRYLRASYPALAGRLAPERMKLAPGNYLDNSKLQTLRREIASHEIDADSIVRKPMYRTGDTQFLNGDAGTIVSFPIKDGKLGSPIIHDTGTLAEILLVARSEDRVAYLSEVGELFMADSSGLRRVELPYVVNPAKFRLLNKDTIVIVDHDMRIYSSVDGGKNWASFESTRVQYATANYDLVNSPRGLYIYGETTGVPAAILYGRSPYTQFESIAPPKSNSSIRGFNKLTVADTGLFIDYGDTKFHFRPHQTGVWQQRSKPGWSCFGSLEFPDNTGERVLVKCSDKRFESRDSGNSWKAI
ncbi:MAG TPA: hypothetical protein VK138_08295 [Acidiferrobacterales bacterium]|nr:hypothetical protein [Acidiferrobacterales bacterium]